MLRNLIAAAKVSTTNVRAVFRSDCAHGFDWITSREYCPSLHNTRFQKEKDNCPCSFLIVSFLCTSKIERTPLAKVFVRLDPGEDLFLGKTHFAGDCVLIRRRAVSKRGDHGGRKTFRL
jgi:hypothetical protein